MQSQLLMQRVCNDSIEVRLFHAKIMLSVLSVEITIYMNVVPRSTTNTNGGTEN